MNGNIIAHLRGRTPNQNQGKSYSRQDLDELRAAYETALGRLIILPEIKYQDKVYRFEVVSPSNRDEKVMELENKVKKLNETLDLITRVIKLEDKMTALQKS